MLGFLSFIVCAGDLLEQFVGDSKNVVFIACLVTVSNQRLDQIWNLLQCFFPDFVELLFM